MIQPTDEVPLPTPDPSPEVTEITAAQERINNIARLMKRYYITRAEADSLNEEIEAMKPTADEMKAAYNTWVIQ